MGIIRYKDIAYGGGSSVTEGYYKVADGKFYEHFDGTTYSDEITGEDGILYLDLSTDNLYRWSTGASLFVLVGKSTLASLNDTNISSPTDGQALEYNGTSSKWVNVAKKAADTPTFSEATGTRSNIVGSGETMATILGKIKRWFTDLKDLAFIGKDGASSTKYLRGDGTWQAFPDLNGEKSVTGNPITFTDGSESYASQLDVELKPIQDLNGYDRPWVGGAGKNKFPYASFNQSSEAHLPAVIKAGTYWISAKRSRDISPAIGLNVRFWYDASNSIAVTGINATGKSITLEQDVIDVSYSITNFQSGDYVYDIQLEVNSSATTYEPYTNICPISGISECSVVDVGKNLFDKDNSSQILEAYINNGVITSWNVARSVYIPCIPSTTYVVSKVSSKRFTVVYTNELPSASVPVYGATTNNEATAISITTGSEAKYLVAFVYNSNVDTVTLDSILNSLQIEYGNQATTYTPYTSSTASITLGQTVYGGNVDFLAGKCVIDRAVKTITGSESGATITWDSYSFKVNDGIDSNSEIGVYESSYSDDALTGSEMYSSRASGHDYGYCVGSGQIMRVRNRSLTQDLASYQTWFQSNTIQVCYKLATPLTIRLSPAELKLLQGNNTVTTNGYSISMKYQPTNVLGDVLESAEEYSNRNIKGWQYWETITGSFYDRSYDKPISDNAKEVMFIARIGVTGDYVATTIATEMLGTVRLYAGTSYLQLSKTKVNASDVTFGVLTIYVR